MNLKTGIDIIEVSRVQENIEKFGDRFLNRIFTEEEIKYCESKNLQKFQSYAGRFAAKENGRPFIKWNGNMKNLFKKGTEIDISISHVQETAVASVVARY